MRYCGTVMKEMILVNPMDNLNETHYIELEKSAEAPVFFVSCCCDPDWEYTFVMESNSVYERIKYNIMEMMFECETMKELLNALSELFEEGFGEMLVRDKCDGHCGCHGC